MNVTARFRDKRVPIRKSCWIFECGDEIPPREVESHSHFFVCTGNVQLLGRSKAVLY